LENSIKRKGIIPDELERSISCTGAQLAIDRPRPRGMTPMLSARAAHPGLLQRARCFP
jgi:hypothetical protein